jgi:hypothetical protein
MVGSDTPENFLMEHLIVGMAEFYSRNLSREIMIEFNSFNIR